MSSDARSPADEASSQCDDASSSSSSSSTSNSSTSNSDQDLRAAFVDDEAEEESDEGESAEDSPEGSSEEADGTWRGLSSVDVEASFPQFTRLPPELRHRIWQDFCPDLSAKARILQFTLSPSSAVLNRPDHYSVKDHLSLADQTQSLRAILATHGESRIIALKKFPDELEMDAGSGDAIVRFKKETDVILLHGFRTGKDYYLPNFSREVQNIAVNPWMLFFGGLLNGPVDEAIPALANIFCNLKRLYVCTAAEAQKAYQIRWCVTDYVHTYLVETYEKEAGLGEDTQSLFCWPDVDQHPDFAKDSIPKLFSRGQDVEAGVEMWPMVEFEFEEGIAQYDRLRLIKDVLNTGDEMEMLDSDEGLILNGFPTDASMSTTDMSEYESEGIDDGELEQADDSSDEEEEEQEQDLTSPMLGRFSSLESASEDGRELRTNDDGSLARRSRKRRAALLDSDDEDSAPQTKRTRKAHMIIDSSDADEDDGEEEEEEDAQGDKDEVSRQPTSRSRRTMPSSEEEEEEEEEGDDEKDKQYDVDDTRDSDGKSSLDSQSEHKDNRTRRRMPLAERLRRARQECPVSSGSETDSQDEDQDDASEEDDDDQDEDELLDVMADEQDGSSTEQDEEW